MFGDKKKQSFTLLAVSMCVLKFYVLLDVCVCVCVRVLVDCRLMMLTKKKSTLIQVHF